MVIQEKNLILLHPGKTAGSSIESIFYDISSNNFNKQFFFGFQYGIWVQHATVEFMKKHIINFDNYEKVLFIRNPYERLLSVYNFGTSCGQRKDFFNACGDYKPHINSFDDFVSKIPEFFKHEPISSGCHLSPQSLYYTDDAMIISFEKLQEDFKLFQKKYNISQPLPHKIPYEKKYHEVSRRSIEIINEYYSNDFELFNYSKK